MRTYGTEPGRPVTEPGRKRLAQPLVAAGVLRENDPELAERHSGPFLVQAVGGGPGWF